MDKIRTMALTAFIVLLPYALYYPYEAISWQLNMAFLQPEYFVTRGWADAEAEIAMATRVVYFAVWFSALLCGVIALFWAFRVVLYFRQGVVFDQRVAHGILWLGRFIVAANVMHILAACVSPMIVSWHNAGGPEPLRFWYSSTHLGMILAGLGFVLMGAVMREAIAIDEDNRKYI